MTWRELYRILEEKVKAEVKVKAKAEVKVKEGDITWIDLLLLLENERSFFSLRKESGRKILVEKEKSSKKILDYFFEKAWERHILKSHTSVI
jgi:hypothetical protein